MPPKTADKKKGDAKKKKGKLDINLKSYDEEDLLPVNCNPTDTVMDLRNAILEVLAERKEEKERETQGDAYVAEEEPSEEELKERALGLSLQFEEAFLDNLEITLAELAFTKDTVIELVRPLPQTGNGSFQFSNGAVYTGEWKLFNREKARHGRGTLVNGKEKYDGQWVKDIIEGHGNYIFATGAVYNGKFVNSTFQGNGKFTWPDASHYEGQWEKNHMNGIGCFTLTNGDKFEGRFENDLFLNDQGHWIPVPKKYPFLPQA